MGNVQTVSLCVPRNDVNGKSGCAFNCAPCVSRMNDSKYENLMHQEQPDRDRIFEQYLMALEHSIGEGVQTLIYTGEIEPLQNMRALEVLGTLVNYVLPARINRRFTKKELQTNAVLLDEKVLEFLKNFMKINTISVSLFSLDSEANMSIVNHERNTKKIMDIKKTCKMIKSFGFTLRLSLNMSTFMYESAGNSIENIFKMAKELGADQITFRMLYGEGESSQANWVKEYGLKKEFFEELTNYIVENGVLIGTLPFGYKQYSLFDISVVVDPDCMHTDKEKAALKYHVIGTDAIAYGDWTTKNRLL